MQFVCGVFCATCALEKIVTLMKHCRYYYCVVLHLSYITEVV